MCNRCPLRMLLFILYACVGHLGGGLPASWLTVDGSHFSSGALYKEEDLIGMAASPVVLLSWLLFLLQCLHCIRIET